jgi:hypothetical protein
MSFYYLVASLPGLDLDGVVPFPSSALPSMWEAQAPPDILEDLKHLLQDRPGDWLNPFFRRWSDLETQLRNAVARRRAAASHREVAPFLRDHEGYEVAVEVAATEAMATDDPLQRERILDRFRWACLEEMAQADRFGPAALFAFAAKLRMVERWQRLTTEAGRQVLEGIVARNLEPATTGSSR